MLLLAVTPLVGAVILGAIRVATGAVCFWVVEGRELRDLTVREPSIEDLVRSLYGGTAS